MTVKDTSEWQTIKIKDEKIPDKPPVPQTGKNLPGFLIWLVLSEVGAYLFIRKKYVRVSEK